RRSSSRPSRAARSSARPGPAGPPGPRSSPAPGSPRSARPPRRSPAAATPPPRPGCPRAPARSSGSRCSSFGCIPSAANSPDARGRWPASRTRSALRSPRSSARSRAPRETPAGSPGSLSGAWSAAWRSSRKGPGASHPGAAGPRRERLAEEEPNPTYPNGNRNARGLMTVLYRIVAGKRRAARELEASAAALRAAAEAAPPARPFAAALAGGAAVSLIAEVKRRSPSAGWIRPEASAVDVAARYEAAGAAAISVLTDEEHFGGTLADLTRVRSAVGVPVLRKDFLVAPVQVWEARAAGADAVLLIVRVLDDAELADLLAASRDCGLGALVEVHGAEELERAVRAGADVIGVNARDLATLKTDLAVTLSLAGQAPAGCVLVAESGIGSRADVERIAAAGMDAVLVGESLMRAPDPGAAAAALVGVARAAPAAAPEVKICGVCRPADAAAAARAGADYVGVVLAPGFTRSQTVE